MICKIIQSILLALFGVGWVSAQSGHLEAEERSFMDNQTETLHLYSHGIEGMLFLEGEWKTPTEISTLISQKFGKPKKIYIYGCYFGRGTKGTSAIEHIANILGAEVSASDDITGIDGDWELEVGVRTLGTPLPDFEGNLQGSYYNGGCDTCDLDGDGIANNVDEDDDNDGILDADEGLSCGAVNMSDLIGLSSITSAVSMKIQMEDYPTGDSVKLELDNGALNGTFGISATPVFYQRDVLLGGDGNGLQISGNINSSESKTATFTFDAPVYNLKFSLADIDGGANSGPEMVTINAYRQDGSLIDLTAADATKYDFNSGNTAITNTVNDPTLTIVNNQLSGAAIYAHNILKFEFNSCLGSQGIVKVEFIFTGAQTTDVAMNISLFDLSYCGGPDNDGDCIPDYHDYDADNDGCPDVVEAGHTDANMDGTLDGTGISSVTGRVTGFATGYTGNTTATIDSAQNDACCNSAKSGRPDADGDLIADECDLDDDNDGILDTDEGCFESSGIDWSDIAPLTANPGSPASSTDTITTASNQSFTVQTSITADVNYTTVHPDGSGYFQARDPLGGGGSGIEFYPHGVSSTSHNNTAEIEFSVPVYNLKFAVTDVDEANGYSDETFDIIASYQGDTITLSPINITQVTGPLPTQTGNHFDGTNAFLENVFIVTYNQPVDKIMFSAGIDSSVVNVANAISVFDFYFEVAMDYDGDGIANCSDLDSDNDGCPDAIEGGGSFTYLDITDGALNGGVDSNGVPIAATNSGQTLGTVQDASQQSSVCSTCDTTHPSFSDFDGDGVGDDCDLDDDNDGILDTDEGNCDQAMDYVFYSSGYGEVFKFYPETGAESLHFTVPTDYYMNGLAYNYDLDLFYGHSDVDFSMLVVYDPSDSSWTNVGQIPGKDFTSGGGEYYDGNLYMGTVDHELYKIKLSADGKSMQSSSLFLATPTSKGGSWGDIAITDACDGTKTMFIYASGHLASINMETATDSGNVSTYITKLPGIGQMSSLNGQLYIIVDTQLFELDNCSFTLTQSNFSTSTLTHDMAGLPVNCYELLDTDGDGVPNYLDLDSDNDGCSDAMESATSPIIPLTYNPNSSLAGGVDSNGVPLVANGGRGVGQSQDSSSLACFSSDPDINAGLVGEQMAGNVSTNDDTDSGTTYGNPVVDPNGSNPNTTDVPSVNSDGTYTFTGNQPGVYTFLVEVCAPGQTSLCPTEMLVITVTDPIDTTNPPIANIDQSATTAGVSVNVNILDNDGAGNPGGSLGVPTVTTQPTNGSVTIDPATGVAIYVPDSGFTGIDTFYYEVCDTTVDPSLCVESFTIIEVIAAGDNDLTATDDYNNTTASTPVSGNAMGNDTDANGDSMAVTAVTTPTPITGGSYTIDANGNYTFTPDEGFSGSTNFTYTVCDVHGLCEMATVYITVTPAPETDPDVNTGLAGVQVTGDVSTNDNVAPGATYGNPVVDPNGSNPNTTDIPMVNPDGTYSFTGTQPGVYTFLVEVCVPGQTSPCPTEILVITVTDPMDTLNPPIANIDQSSTAEGTPVDVNILDNDGAGNAGGSLGVPTVTTQATNGTVTIAPATGVATYTPDSGFVGIDTFYYQVCDTTVEPASCAETMSIIEVLATGENGLTAADDCSITSAGTPVSGSVLDNDYDPNGDAMTVTAVTTPTTITGGSYTIDANGNYTFTPDAGFSGSTNFIYEVCDANGLCEMATVYITVAPIPETDPDINVTTIGVQVPGNVSTNDNAAPGTTYSNPVVDPNGSNPNSTDVPTINPDGSYTFTGTQAGVYTFLVEVCASGQPSPCPSELLTIMVLDTTSNSNAPVASIDLSSTPLNTAVTVNLTNNDMASTSYGSLGTPTLTGSTTSTTSNGGTVSINANGELLYTPANGFTGVDTVYYEVCDTTVNPDICVTSMAIIDILPASQNGIAATDDYNTGTSGTPVTGNAMTNDSDPNGDNLTVFSNTINTPGVGTFTIDDAGNYNFTPDPSFIGPVNFVYQICDDNGLCTDATIYILISNQNVVNIGLDVEDFNAESSECEIQLDWRVASTENAKEIILERREEGEDYYAIVRYNVAANSTQPSEYSYVDTEIIDKAAYYYRLKLVSLNSTYTYSQSIRSASSCNQDQHRVTVYPNPSKDKFKVNLEGFNNQTVELKVYDMLGRMVTFKNTEVQSNLQTETIDLRGYGDGQYYLNIITSEKYTNQIILLKIK